MIPRRLIAAAILPVALALAGCGARAAQVEAALVDAGVSRRMAACLAPRLADRLGDDQLRALARAPRGGGSGVSGIVARVAATGDPATIETVSSAALHCASR